MNYESVSNEAVCRTVRATPGLLNIQNVSNVGQVDKREKNVLEQFTTEKFRLGNTWTKYDLKKKYSDTKLLGQPNCLDKSRTSPQIGPASEDGELKKSLQ